MMLPLIKTTASAKGAVAIGKILRLLQNDAVAIGTNAQLLDLNSVALGSGSTTATGATSQGSTTINGITYNFAGATGNPNMQVSVGSAGATRQIKKCRQQGKYLLQVQMLLMDPNYML